MISAEMYLHLYMRVFRKVNVGTRRAFSTFFLRFIMLKSIFSDFRDLTKNPPPQKKGPKCWTLFFDFFGFFSNFVPDLGDQFWYNRLSFWAGLRSKKKTLFFDQNFIFQNIFFDLSHSFPTPRSGQKNISKIFIFSSYPTLFYPILPQKCSYGVESLEID